MAHVQHSKNSTPYTQIQHNYPIQYSLSQCRCQKVCSICDTEFPSISAVASVDSLHLLSNLCALRTSYFIQFMQAVTNYVNQLIWQQRSCVCKLILNVNECLFWRNRPFQLWLCSNFCMQYRIKQLMQQSHGTNSISPNPNIKTLKSSNNLCRSCAFERPTAGDNIPDMDLPSNHDASIRFNVANAWHKCIV